MNTTTDKLTNGQLRHLFWLFKELEIGEDARRLMVDEWTKGRTDSVGRLGFIEAMNLIRRLEEIRRMPHTRRDNGSLDTKRKGVMKAIYAYLNLCGIEPSMDYVKRIAIRASGMAPTGCVSHDFNRISSAALTRIYNEFCCKQTSAKERRDIVPLNRFSLN